VANYLDVPTASGASTPNQAGLAAGTGTLDLRLELAPNSWASGAFQALISQDPNGPGSRFWWGIQPAGTLEYDFYNIGGTFIDACVAPGFAPGSSHGLRLLHNIGAGTIDYYTATDFSTWAHIQAQSTGKPTTGMATSGTAPVVRVGTDVYAEPMVGQITRIQVLINGVTLLNEDWTNATPGTGPWVATSGETWTRIGTASVIGAAAAVPGTVALAYTKTSAALSYALPTTSVAYAMPTTSLVITL
jgi:hypothetical protein